MDTPVTLTKTQKAAIALVEAAHAMFPDLHFMVVTMDDDSYSVRFNTDCADLASVMVGGACNAIEANINSGAMHVHGNKETMRAVPSGSATSH